MTEPPKNVDPNKTHALKGKTWNQLSESIKQRTPKSSKDVLIKEMPDGYHAELADRKTAILPLDLGAGQIEWVAWTCVEADQAFFRIIRDVEDGEALEIPPEMIGSCEPGSLKVVSAMPVGGLAVVSAEVIDQARVQWTLAALPGIAAPHSVRVAIEGVRLGMPEIWPRTTPKVAERNRLFWASAHQGGVHELTPEVDHEWPASRGEGE
jgi:hypothetical protein